MCGSKARTPPCEQVNLIMHKGLRPAVQEARVPLLWFCQWPAPSKGRGLCCSHIGPASAPTVKALLREEAGLSTHGDGSPLCPMAVRSSLQHTGLRHHLPASPEFSFSSSKAWHSLLPLRPWGVSLKPDSPPFPVPLPSPGQFLLSLQAQSPGSSLRSLLAGPTTPIRCQSVCPPQEQNRREEGLC